MRKYFLLLAPIVIGLLVAGLLSTEKPTSKPNIPSPDKITPTPTPFPFADMTIPHLRSRTYSSQLGKLEEYSQQDKYVSYLTNYSSDGLRINGLLTIPKGSQPKTGYPAIVFIHGYINPQSYRTTRNYEAYVDKLASNGFVVFKIDLRGHGNSEGEASGAYYSSDYIVDTLNAIAALKKYSLVNPKAIGLWGHSMAGNIVLRSLVSLNDAKAAVIWAGAGYTYTDLVTYRISDQSYRPPAPHTSRSRKRQQLRETYGEFDPQHSFWKQIIPTNYLSGGDFQIQLHHAIDDNVVSIEYSRNLIQLLSANTVSNQLYEYPSGGHNINGPSFATAMSRTIEFFHRTLD